MKSTLISLLALCIATCCLAQSNAVVYNLEMENYYHPPTANRLYNVINSAFTKCGRMTVRHNHQWKKEAKRPTDILVLEQEVNQILLDIVFKEIPRTPEDRKKVEGYANLFTTDIIILPELVRFGYDMNREYELTIHVLSFPSLSYLEGSLPIYFSQKELDDIQVAETKICDWIAKEGKTGSRDILEYEGIDSPSLESYRRWVRAAIRLDRTKPSENDLPGELSSLCATKKGKRLFLNEKATVISQEILFLLKLDRPDADTAIQLFEEEIETLKELYDLEDSPSGRREIKEKILDFSHQLNQIINQKT